jgi:hypothetical protein
MRAYDELVQNFRALLECQTVSEFESLAERTLADGVWYAVFGPQHKGNFRRVVDESVRLKRYKEAIEECLKEMWHDGVNVFRVIVYAEEDDSDRKYPMAYQNGTVHERRYHLQSHVDYEIWVSLLSRGDQNVRAYYTEYEKEEKYEGEYAIRQTFRGHKLGILRLTYPDEVDVYRLATGDNNAIVAMTFGLKPVTLEEIEKQFMQANAKCVAVDLQVQGHLCKCFLVPHITSKVEHFRQMASWDKDPPYVELSTRTVNQVKVYVLCPVDCKVSLHNKQGQPTSSCQATANTCALVGTTQAILPNTHDMQHNEFHVVLLEKDFPFYATVGTPSTLETPWEAGTAPPTFIQPASPEYPDPMQLLQVPPISALLTELALSA